MAQAYITFSDVPVRVVFGGTVGGGRLAKFAHKHVPTYDITVNTVGYLLASHGSPGDSLNCQIFSGGSDPDTGSTLIATADSTIPASSLVVDNPPITFNNTFTFTSGPTLTIGNTYWIVISRTSSLDPNNNYYIGTTTTSGGPPMTKLDFLDTDSWQQHEGNAWSQAGSNPNFFYLGIYINQPTSSVSPSVSPSPANDLPGYHPSVITAVTKVEQNLPFTKFVMGGRGGAGGAAYSLFKKDDNYTFNIWRSPVYKIGNDFDVLDIEFNILGGVTGDKEIIPVLRFDDDRDSSVGTTINTTNYPNSDKLIQLTSKNFNNEVHGQSNFYLELQMTGTDLAVVGLPINITIEEYEN